jgi:hypothetical protein
MLAGQILEITLDPRLQQLAQRATWLLKGRLSVSAVVAVDGAALLVWVVAGNRLRGAALLLWLLVPILALAACVCVAGPGRLFNKRAHEGRIVVLLTPHDAVTTLDLLGLGLAATGILLAVALIGWRLHASGLLRRRRFALRH